MRHLILAILFLTCMYLTKDWPATEEGPDGGFGIFGLLPYLVEGK